jgi:hypothetical protein
MSEQQLPEQSDSPIVQAYLEIVSDTTVLWDPDVESPRAAVVVQLERDGWGSFHADVNLNEIEGSQLAFVLAVARKWELEAREERGWLRLARHYNDSDIDEEEPVPAEEVGSS